MLKTRASDPKTITSCSESLGTETYRVSPGLAAEGLNVKRLTVRSAFMAPRVFSLCEGSRLGGTAVMVYIVFLNFINVVIYFMSDDYDPTETTEKTPLIPGGADDDDDDEWRVVDLLLHPIPEEQWRFPTDTDPNTTNPFDPGASSTPSGGENIPMATRLPTEQQGASGGTAETSFSTGFDQGHPITLQNMARREIEGEFSKVKENPTEFDFRYREASRSGGLIIKVKYHTSDKWYPPYTKSRGDVEKTINTSLPNRIKDALGKSLTDTVNETTAVLQDLQKQEEAQRKALQQAQTKADEAQRLRREMDAIRGRTKDVADRMQELEDTQGPLDKDAIQKLKDEKRKLAADHQAKRKQLDALAKAAQQAQKLQQDINKTRLSKGETERRLGQLKAQKDAIQPLDELKQKAAELNEHITEDMRIIEDEKTSPSEVFGCKRETCCTKRRVGNGQRRD